MKYAINKLNCAFFIVLIFLSINVNAQVDDEKKQISQMPEAVYEKIVPLTVRITNKQNVPGTGIIIGISEETSDNAVDLSGNQALILTACHVISSNYKDDAADLDIVLEYYDSIKVKIGGEFSDVLAEVHLEFIDRSNDIAIITAPVSAGVEKAINYKEGVNPGLTVAAFGFPHTDELNQTVGTITREEGNYYVFDAGVKGGNSGGPLVDDNGNMVGMTTFVAGEENEGYAIKVNLIATVVNNWLADTNLKQYWQPVDEGSFWTKPFFYIPAGTLGAVGVVAIIIGLSGTNNGTVEDPGITVTPPARP